jgi:hypothetical protein
MRIGSPLTVVCRIKFHTSKSEPQRSVFCLCVFFTEFRSLSNALIFSLCLRRDRIRSFQLRPYNFTVASSVVALRTEQHFFQTLGQTNLLLQVHFAFQLPLQYLRFIAPPLMYYNYVQIQILMRVPEDSRSPNPVFFLTNKNPFHKTLRTNRVTMFLI